MSKIASGRKWGCHVWNVGLVKLFILACMCLRVAAFVTLPVGRPGALSVQNRLVCSKSLLSAAPVTRRARHSPRHSLGCLDMVWRSSTQNRYEPNKVFPLMNGEETLIIGKDGWFVSSEIGESVGNQYGDQAIPLELDDQIAWILYRDGVVIRTITEDELDVVDPILGGSGSDPLLAARTGGAFMEALSGFVDVISGKGRVDRVDAGLGFRIFEGLVSPTSTTNKDWMTIRDIATEEQLSVPATEAKPWTPKPRPAELTPEAPPLRAEESSEADEAGQRAVRLLQEAEASLNSGQLDQVLDLAGQAQEALSLVQARGGSVNARIVAGVVEIQARLIAQMKQSVATRTDENAQQAAAAAAASAASEQAAPQAAPKVASDDGKWKEAKDRGVDLDKQARKALQSGNYSEAAALSKKAAEAFSEAVGMGYRKGNKYVKACMGVLERAAGASSGGAVARVGVNSKAQGGGVVGGKGVDDGKAEKERFDKAVAEAVKVELAKEKAREKAKVAAEARERERVREELERVAEQIAASEKALADATKAALEYEEAQRRDMEWTLQAQRQEQEQQEELALRRQREAARAREAAAEGLRRREEAMAKKRGVVADEQRQKLAEAEREREAWLRKYGLEMGTKVIAVWYQDGYEYDALVISPTSPDTINVVFVGYGEEQETNPADIRAISQDPPRRSTPPLAPPTPAASRVTPPPSAAGPPSLAAKPPPRPPSPPSTAAADKPFSEAAAKGGGAVLMGRGGVDGEVGYKEYPLDVKYHGILLGKQAVTVKALQQASGALISFKKEGREFPSGAVVIKGTRVQREQAWQLLTSVKDQLPKVLNMMRGSDIKKGDLKSKPDLEGRVQDKDDQWVYAVDEAMARASEKEDTAKL